jgi:hypothetical protein
VDQLAEFQGQGAAGAIAGQVAELLAHQLQLVGEDADKAVVVTDAGLLAGPGLNGGQGRRRSFAPSSDLLQGAQAVGQQPQLMALPAGQRWGFQFGQFGWI